MSVKSRFLVLTFLILSVLPVIGFGQGTTVSILGSVYDQSKAVLPGVTITASDKDTGQRRTVVTDDQGRYVMPQMKVGNYTLQAELPGFQTATRDVVLTLEGDAVTTFTLTVGASQTEVTVTSEAPLVETASSAVKNLVDTQQIRDLPLNGRSFTDLATLQTGVSPNLFGSTSQIGNEGIKLSISGARQTSTLFQLDGTDIRNQRNVTPGSLAGVQLGVDTVQEFTVITTVANAEFGGFTGGVVNAVTKSGTNSFHGSLFEFLRNSALDARNFFDRNSNPPPFKRNQYGFTVGGPIRRDKIFFFGSFEGLNDRLATTQTASVPSLSARQGLIPNIGQLTLSPVTKPFLDAYPLPNGVIRPDGTADYIYTAPRVIDEQYFVGKVDWQMSEKDNVAWRYTYDGATRTSPINIDVIFDDSRTRNQFMLMEWRRLFSSKLVNEARVSLNRSLNATDIVENKPLPAAMHYNPLLLTFAGKPFPGTLAVPSLTGLGFASVQIQQNVLNRFQYVDNLTYATGAHSLKAGFNIQRLQFNSAQPAFSGGSYSLVSLREFITGGPARSFAGTITGMIPKGMRETLLAFYVQDDWRLSSRLTVNAGVRYETYTLPVEVAGRLGNLRHPSDSTITVGNPLFTANPSRKNFAPRVGFAWDPTGGGKTSIRAGYGRFLELVDAQHYYASIFSNPPLAIRVTLNNPPFPNYQSALPSDVSRIVTAPWIFSDEIEQGGVDQYQLSIQRQVFSDLVVQVAYMGSRGYNLVHILDRNTAIPQRDAQGGYPFFAPTCAAGQITGCSTRRNPSFGQMRDYAWDGSSNYNAMGLSVKKRFSKGYSLQGSYTYGKTIDDGSNSTTGQDSGGQPNNLSTFTDDIKLDKGLSSLDVRNRLSINGSWDLPFGAGRAIGSDWHGVIEQIAGGWSLNGILTAANGNRRSLVLPFNWSRSQQTTDIPDRPSLIPGGNNSPVLSDGRDPSKYFDGSQFILGPAGYFGNLGRNTLERPGVLTMDFSVQKNFNFSEEKRLQFRAEMFNIANRANFGEPDTSSILNETGARSLTTGRITSTNTTARQVQFGLKLYF